MKSILVPLDGSALSERALAIACALARDLEMKLALLHVKEPQTTPEIERDAEAAVRAALWHVRQQYGLEATMQTRPGYPAHAIVDEAVSNDIWAFAMASHSREALSRLVLGSVTEQVIDLSPVPVFVVPASVEAPGLPRFRRILVPLDGSQRAEAILKPVHRLAGSLGSDVLALRVFVPASEKDRVPPERLRAVGQVVDGVTPEELAAAYRHEREQPGTAERVELGDPVQKIVDVCGREHVDLVAFATYGRTSLDRERLSNVAEAVLRHSRVPLMAFGREALKRLAADSPELLLKATIGHEDAFPAAHEAARARLMKEDASWNVNPS